MTNHRSVLCAVFILLIAAAAVAADVGGHVGYFDNDVKKAYIGVDAGLPLGPIALMPNIDYWRANGYGYWLGNANVALKWAQPNGASFWVGAGPTYGWVTGSGSSGGSSGYAMRPAPSDYGPTPSPSPSPSPTPGNPSNPGTPTTGAATTGGIFGNGEKNAWGWDVTGGISFGEFAGGLRPYVTANYNKVKNLKVAGVAVGIRFGH